MAKTHEEILNKLPQNVAKHIVDGEYWIKRYKEEMYNGLATQHQNTMRGYIVCLRDCGYITDADMRKLIERYVQK